MLPSGTQVASYSWERLTLSLVNEQNHATTRRQSCRVQSWTCQIGIVNVFLPRVLGSGRCPDAVAAGLCLPGSRPRALPPPCALQIQILLFLAVAPRTGMYCCLFLAQSLLRTQSTWQKRRYLQGRAGIRGSSGGSRRQMLWSFQLQPWYHLNPGMKNTEAFVLGVMAQFQHRCRGGWRELHGGESGCCVRRHPAKGPAPAFPARAIVTGCCCAALISARQHGSHGTRFCPSVIST